MKKNTIKKTLQMVIGGMVIALVISLMPGNIFTEASKGFNDAKTYKIKQDIKRTMDQTKYIIEKEAIAIAITKIGKDAKLDKIEFKVYDNPPKYEVEMHDDKYEYDIEIHAITGEVLEFEIEEYERKVVNEEPIIPLKYITKEEAIKIALTKIGKDAKLNEIEFEIDDNIPKYEVEMYDDKNEYDVDIHAVTGVVLEFEIEAYKRKDHKEEPTTQLKYITKEEAIKIALAKIGKDAKLDEVEFENDDNTPKYEVEMYDDKYEYDIEIHAITGVILEFEMEAYKIKDEKEPIIQLKYITKEEAIKIALAKIGKDAKLDEIEFESDDNPPKYEIEMYDDKYEYEIEIHAITGAILEFEREID